MDNTEEVGPPEDFRSLSVTPSLKDLTDDLPYLRACKVKDHYDSVAHYLDVQFRLLREDFVSPLRRGLAEFLSNGQRYRNSDLRVYKKVKLLAPEIDKKNNNLGIRIYFGELSVNWEDSKRFTPGGLVLLSSDLFKSVIFATVLDTDPKRLRKGYALIDPIDRKVITRGMYKATYTMLESKVYFEPYRAVLSAMRLMSDFNFPMKEYLVDATRTSRLPRYLQNRSLFTEIDSPWQASQKRRLNESQYNAFKHALSEELAVIQGPPGTGKTFIALEIVQTLLLNKQRWITYGPIVVVCFTNHALDQFLEGILKHTQSIVRIGERSKSEALKPYTLRELRQQSIRNRNSRHDGNALARRNLYEARNNVATVLSQLSTVHSVIQHLTASEAIVPLECLVEYCNDGTLRCMRSNEDLVMWLIGGKLHSFLYRSDSIQTNEFTARQDETEACEVDDSEWTDDFFELDYEEQTSTQVRNVLTRPVKDLDSKLEVIDKRIEELTENVEQHPNPFTVQHCQYEINHWEWLKSILLEERQNLMSKFTNHPIMHPDPRDESRSNDDNWSLYWSWVKTSFDSATESLNTLNAEYLRASRELNEAKQLVDLDILRRREIIGLTTTLAARLHVTLAGLHAPIVIVEEAAEILESHIVCSMTKDCQHVILIGDHKQLRPKPSDYFIGKNYNLEVSLFERMVNIRGDCNQLTKQHRMRPEIVKLITPSIYETLESDRSVYMFPKVKGLEKNLFFLNHNNTELKHNDESWTNQFEAKFLITFATHLVKQGYETKDITVLSTYMGQMFELRNEKKKFPILEDLYITTVDNYQGEENRIIILSLVRNNGEGNIGFLKEENRVCVALSRAREGLYIMGNMDDLSVKNIIWPEIKKTLEDQKAIGDCITLRCQNHPEQTMNVRGPNDFMVLCPEGGCSKICNAQLECGHTCVSSCHILDSDHELYECVQPCLKTCPRGHPCPLKCGQACRPCLTQVKCTLNCGHEINKPCSVGELACYHKVKVILPDCNHEVEKPCYLPIARVQCTHSCENNVKSCGHPCELKCHVNNDPDHLEYQCRKECSKECANNHPCKKLCYQDCGNCPVVMQKERSCGHFFKNVFCWVKVEEIPCARPCKRILSCDHKCPMKCSEICGNCPVKVLKKISSCGHEVTLKCCEDATADKCTGPCQKKLSCGHPCDKRCKDPCTSQCQVKVRLDKPGLCGHLISVPCYLRNIDAESPDLLKYCEEPCGVKLECNHLCAGNCGQCLQGRIHVQCQEPCTKILICGHLCSMPCREDCRGCKKPCEIRCAHSKCKKECGLPCKLCNEKCIRGCEHQKCTKRCSQDCNIEPCNEPCKKLLKCRHPCVGFCGETCPPLCRICDKDELTNQEDENSRFVYVENCGHCIESSRFTQSMESSDELENKWIQPMQCPECDSPITKCSRIVDKIKKHQGDLIRVKERILSSNKNLKDFLVKQVEMFTEMVDDQLISEFVELKIFSKKLSDYVSLATAITKKKKSQSLNPQEIDAFKIKLEILHRILAILKLVKNKNSPCYLRVKDQVRFTIKSVPDHWLITKQNLQDFQLELIRLRYLVEVNNKLTNQLELNFMVKKILRDKRFTKEFEKEIQDEMYRLNLDDKFENQEIFKTLNLNEALLLKCPDGHIFFVAKKQGDNLKIYKCDQCSS